VGKSTGNGAVFDGYRRFAGFCHLTVSRVLSELNREGLIAVKGRTIELKNLQKLNEILIDV
jgi:DNA-binding transcriptional regulator YhcF (GntR family)